MTSIKIHQKLILSLVLACFTFQTGFSAPEAIKLSDEEVKINGKRKVQYTSEVLDELFKIYNKTPGKKVRKLEAIVDHFSNMVGWEDAAQLSIGAVWKRLDDKQKEEYMKLFKPFFNTAALYQFGHFVNGSRKDVRVIGRPDNLTVQDDNINCLITRPGNMKFLLTFKVRTMADNEFKVINVIGEGVDMQEVYKTRFSDAFEKGGGEEVLNVMRNQIERGKKDRFKW